MGLEVEGVGGREGLKQENIQCDAYLRKVNRTSSVRLAFADALIPLYCVSDYRGQKVEQQIIQCDTDLY